MNNNQLTPNDSSTKQTLSHGSKAVIWQEEKRAFFSKNPTDLYIPLFYDIDANSRLSNEVFSQ